MDRVFGDSCSNFSSFVSANTINNAGSNVAPAGNCFGKKSIFIVVPLFTGVCLSKKKFRIHVYFLFRENEPAASAHRSQIEQLLSLEICYGLKIFIPTIPFNMMREFIGSSVQAGCSIELRATSFSFTKVFSPNDARKNFDSFLSNRISR